MKEVVDGHGGENAADRYDSEGFLGYNESWCSEFVRWVYAKTMDLKDLFTYLKLWSISNVGDCRKFFQSNSIRRTYGINETLWYYSYQITPDTAQVGEYIAVRGGDHSALIVAI